MMRRAFKRRSVVANHEPFAAAAGVLAGISHNAGGLALQPAQAADDFFDSDAQTPSPITDHFALRASFFHASVDTDSAPGSAGQIRWAAPPCRAPQDLGFKPSENDGLAELMFRLRDRNRITADFLELDQSGTRRH